MFLRVYSSTCILNNLQSSRHLIKTYLPVCRTPSDTICPCIAYLKGKNQRNMDPIGLLEKTVLRNPKWFHPKKREVRMRIKIFKHKKSIMCIKNGQLCKN